MRKKVRNVLIIILLLIYPVISSIILELIFRDKLLIYYKQIIVGITSTTLCIYVANKHLS